LGPANDTVLPSTRRYCGGAAGDVPDERTLEKEEEKKKKKEKRKKKDENESCSLHKNQAATKREQLSRRAHKDTIHKTSDRAMDAADRHGAFAF
jgi:hypothetical protein